MVTANTIMNHEAQESVISTDLVPFSHTPPSRPEGELHIKMLVQPEDVQVKRVGRASCIEPELKLSVETDSMFSQTITLNAYLKVLGKDNKHKMILLRKSDEMVMSRSHKKEIASMKLRFLKTIKVQVLKRNLGVARPEASVIFEAVNRHGEVLSSAETTHFVIISDPRYLDEVKRRSHGHGALPLTHTHKRERGDHELVESDEDAYHPPIRTYKKRRFTSVPEYEGPLSSADHTVPLLINSSGVKSEPSSPFYDQSPYSPYSPPSSSELPISSPPIYLTPLQKLKDISDFELLEDSEEEYKLIKLVESLKHRGCGHPSVCSFQVLQPSARA